MLPRMNIQQRRRANKLLKHLCANYQDGNCLLLDDDEPCVCVQSISYSLCCNYFRVAVLPTEPTLEAEILDPKKISYCKDCKLPFVKRRYNQLFCEKCAKLRYKKQQAEYARKRRLNSRKSDSQKASVYAAFQAQYLRGKGNYTFTPDFTIFALYGRLRREVKSWLILRQEIR